MGCGKNHLNHNGAVLIYVITRLIVGLCDTSQGNWDSQSVSTFDLFSSCSLRNKSYDGYLHYKNVHVPSNCICLPSPDRNAIMWNFLKSDRKKCIIVDHVTLIGSRTCRRCVYTRPRVVVIGLLACAGDVHLNPGPAACTSRVLQDCIACSRRVNSKYKLRCADCKNFAHPSCVGTTQKRAQIIIANSLPWYCSDCCAPCSVCDGNVLSEHHAVQCDRCEKWLHTTCCNIDDLTYTSLMSSDCNWVCPLCDAINFSDSFFNEGDISVDNSVDGELTVVGSPRGNKPNNDHSSAINDQTKRKTRAKKTTPKLRDRIRIVLTNCQSVKSKAGDIAVLLDTIKPDFICGTESWLDPSINSAEIFPENYAVFRKDRKTTTTGGGVFQTVKGDLPSTHCSELNSDCEILWTETKVKGCRPMLIGVFYRPPKDNGEAMEILGQSFANLGNKINSHNIILTGDFNLPNIDWSDNSVSTRSGYSSKAAEQLVTLVEEHGLTQHVNQPTRKQGNAENILDLVFTNNPDMVDKITVVEGISDHSSVIVDLRIAPIRKRPVKRKVYLRNKADTDGVTQALEDFTDEYFKNNKGKTVTEKWDCIKTAILQTMDKCVPHKMTSSRFNLPWFDRTLRRAVKKKQRLYNKAIKSGKASDWEVFRECRRNTHKLIKKTRSTYIRETLGSAIKEEPKKFWTFIKKLSQENPGVADLEKDGKIISDDTEKANILNEQFQSVFTKEPPGELPQLGTSPYEQIGKLIITKEGVEKLLSQLKPNKAPGPDGIPPWFLKLGAKQLASPLQDLFQSSINTGEVPQDWKEANIK